jgi:hypothetical protein
MSMFNGEEILKITIYILSIFSLLIGFAPATGASNNLPMDRVYQGQIRLPDFSGRDRAYSNYRTRITNEMRTGPNFAGHYAIVEIGCGTGCRFAFVGDVATGQVFDFPYGGEDYYLLDLKYDVKSKYVSAKWIDGDNCLSDFIEWDGRKFISNGGSVIGPREKCE